MSHTATSGMENLMRIETLIANNLTNILQKENDNVSNINLYGIGDYWVAFEYSAFQLEQISDYTDGTLVMRLKNRPFPIVLNIISNANLKRLYKHYSNKEFLQLSAAPLDKESFSTWYRDLTMEVN